MSANENTTNTPADKSAPAATTPYKTNGMPDGAQIADLIKGRLVSMREPLEAASAAKPDAAPQHSSPPEKPTEQPPKIDRRFKLTPENADAPKADAQQPPTIDIDDILKAELPKGSTEFQQKNWQRARAALESYKAKESEWSKKDAEYQKKIAETARNTPPSADYEKLKSDHQQALDKLAKYNLREHPEFIAKFSLPKQAALAEAQEILNFAGKEVDLSGLLGKNSAEIGKSLQEITKGMSDFERGQVADGVRKAVAIEREAQKALQNAKATNETFQQRSAYQSQAEFDASWKDNGVSEFLQKHEISDGLDEATKQYMQEYNSGIDAVKGAAIKYAFDPQGPRETAAIAQKAAAFDFLQNTGMKAVERLLNQIASERDSWREKAESYAKVAPNSVPKGGVDSTPKSPQRSVQYGGHGLRVEEMASTIRGIMRDQENRS